MTEILQKLVGQPLNDLILYGVVDTNDEPADFIPFLDRIFLDVGGSLVEITEDTVTAGLTVCMVANVRYTFESELEEGHLPCRSSIGKYVLVNPHADNRIVKIVGHGVMDGAYQALEFALQSGQILFFDPLFWDGINFGGIEQKSLWLANAESHESITIE
jgi:hypothetical protein